jgi:hypothetical protein
MTLQLVSAPAVEPLTVAEARARLNIGSELTDAVLSALISAGRQMIDGVDGLLGRALVTQTWDLVLDHFSGMNRPLETGFYGSSDHGGYGSRYDDIHRMHRHRHGIVIPLPPLQSVTSVNYIDTDGVNQTVDPATYLVQKGTPSHIVLANGATWPSVNITVPGSVTIRFIAGYGDKGTDVPEPIRTAIALQASHLRSLTQQNLFLSRESVPGIIDRNWTMGGGAETAINGAVQALLTTYRVWL